MLRPTRLRKVSHGAFFRFAGCRVRFFPHKYREAGELRELAAKVSEHGEPIVWIVNVTPARNYLMTLLAREAHCVANGIGAGFGFLAGLRPEAPR